MAIFQMIYDSEYKDSDYFLEFLEDFGITKEQYEKNKKKYENDFLLYCDEEKNNEYNDNIANIVYHEDAHGRKEYVVKAILGLWDGKHEGGRIISGMRNVILRCSSGCDFFRFFIEGRCMRFISDHHDGTNSFWIKELTERGEKYYKAHKDEMGQREMVEKLFNDRHLSRHVTIWNEMYGM